MTQWVNNESGPDCHCGNPTLVKVNSMGGAILLCLFHTSAEDVYWQLPEQRPDDWPNLTMEQLAERYG